MRDVDSAVAHKQLPASPRDHRPVVGAQLIRRHEQPFIVGLAGVLHIPSESLVPGDSPGEHNIFHALVKRRLNADPIESFPEFALELGECFELNGGCQVGELLEAAWEVVGAARRGQQFLETVGQNSSEGEVGGATP